jgi:hypothetical protein
MGEAANSRSGDLMQNLGALTDAELRKAREACETLMKFHTDYGATSNELHTKIDSLRADIIAKQEERAAGDRRARKGKEGR